MHRLWLLLLILVLPLFLSAGIPRLSDKAEISLITCSPGPALYEAFGHSAIRVHDPLRGIDRAYNYGTFDFNQPHFYSNFAKGRLIYFLSVSGFDRFVYSYIYYNRSVYEDEINLNYQEKQALFNLLEINYLPENREYRYDYIYDNCSTRIRDILEKTLGRKLEFDGSYIKTKYSFRDLMDLYLEPQPWGDLGIDLALGSPIDKTATPYEYMFLPHYLQSGFKHATITREDTVMPLIKKSLIVNQATPDDHNSVGLLTPTYVFWTIFLITLGITIRDFVKKRKSLWLDMVLFGFFGLVGVILGYISFISDHWAAANNFNLLWAIPLHLPFALLLPFKPKNVVVRYYFLIAAIIGVLLLFTDIINLIPQDLNYAVYPLILALAVRGFALYLIKRC